MKRTLLSTLVITSTLGINANVFALGMGELELKSTLNQPLNAEIELTNIEDLTEWEIKPSLASDGDFDRAGVEKIFFLSDIDFEVKGSRIILSSDKSVTEPFLNFLVQVNWPSGRVLREYTLLLDPPLFDETIQPLEAVAVPENTQAKKVESQQTAPSQQKNKWQTEDAKQGTYKVQPNDTLWEIAIETRPSRKISPQQMMLAIQDSNPGAFMSGNINRLKTHQVLRIPNEQQMAARNDGQAISEVLRQNKESQTAGAQLDATSKASQANEIVAPEAGGELKLLAKNDETSASAAASEDVNSGSADGGRTEKLENELAIALETLDTSKLENDDLKKRLDALEEQIATLQRLVSLKDDQLASIQTMDLQKQDAADSTASQLSNQGAELATDASAGEALASDELAAEGLATDDLATEEADFNYAEEPAIDPAPALASPEVDPAMAANQLQQVEDRYKPKGFVAEIMAKPALMGGIAGGAALLLGLIGFAIKKRRDKGEGEVTDPALVDFTDDQSIADKNLDDASLDNFEFAEDDTVASELTDDLLDGIGSEETAEGEDDTVAQTADIIGEAEIYIAYGRFDQAADLLNNSIRLEPSRIDLRMKLLEVYLEIDDATLFAEAELDLNSLGDLEADAKAIAMRNQLSSPITGEESSDFDALNEDLIGESSSVDAALADTSMPESEEILDMAQLADSEDEFETGVDFEAALDLSDEAEQTSTEDSESFAASLDALDDDGLDFDFGEMEDVSVTGQELDFDLTSESDDTNEAPTPDADDEIPTLDELENIPTLSELDELPEADESVELLENSADEIPTLDDLDGLGDLNDSLGQDGSSAVEDSPLEKVESSEQEQNDDFVNIDSLETADDSDLSELESLLDSDDSTDDLSDFSFDLEEASLENEQPSADDSLSDDSLTEDQLSEDLLSQELDADLRTLESEFNELSESSIELSAEDSEAAGEIAELDLSESDIEDLDDTLEESKTVDALADLEEVMDSPSLESDSSEPVLESGSELDSFEVEGFDANSEFDLNELDDLPDFTESVVVEAVAAPQAPNTPSANEEIDLDQLAAADDEFDFLAGTDVCATKLDLARAYMDMEDNEGAKELLQEVISEGSDQQKHDARALMDSIG